MSTTARSGGRRRALVINWVSHCFYVITLPISYLLSMFSVMLFDGPGSEEKWSIWAFYYALKSYPYIVVIAIVFAWFCYRKTWYTWTYPVNAVPAVIIIVCIGLISFGD